MHKYTSCIMISTNYFTFGLLICVVAAFGFPEDFTPVAPGTEAAENQTCPENEEFLSCGTACPKTCSTMDKDLFCIALCREGCFCKPGYVRNDDGLCIPTEECPTITCGANETRLFCNARCPTSYCPTNDGPKPQCSPPFPCPTGCGCKANYKLNGTDQCILATECPPISCTRPNEVFSSCPQPCSPEHCEDLNLMSGACKFLESSCDPKCVCQEGYLRDNTGTCVPKSQCKAQQQCPQNEQFSECPLALCRPKTCQERGKSVACPGIAYPCPSGCICNEGFLRNNNGTCMPEDQCPCPNNEELVDCIQQVCPGTCDQLSRQCQAYDAAFCTKGCACTNGYLRDRAGYCIPKENCAQLQ